MMDPHIGEIMDFAGTYAPEGWELCSGQLLQVHQNPALYSILGNRFGGDGVTTFGLPDLRPTVNGVKTWQQNQLLKCIAVQGIYPVRP